MCGLIVFDFCGCVFGVLVVTGVWCTALDVLFMVCWGRLFDMLVCLRLVLMKWLDFIC